MDELSDFEGCYAALESASRTGGARALQDACLRLLTSERHALFGRCLSVYLIRRTQRTLHGHPDDGRWPRGMLRRLGTTLHLRFETVRAMDLVGKLLSRLHVMGFSCRRLVGSLPPDMDSMSLLAMAPRKSLPRLLDRLDRQVLLHGPRALSFEGLSRLVSQGLLSGVRLEADPFQAPLPAPRRFPAHNPALPCVRDDLRRCAGLLDTASRLLQEAL